MSAATQLDPLPQRSIQDEAEDVRIAVRALDDMRHGALLHSPPHPPSSGCAYLPASSILVMFNPSRVSSLSAYAGPLDRILVQLSNAHYSDSCLGGLRGGRGLVFPRLDHPCCRHRPPSI